MNNRELKLDFNGQEIKFRFGLGFLGMVVRETEYTVDTIISGLSQNYLELTPVLMSKAAKYAAKRDGKDIDYTAEDFIDLVDDCGGVTAPQFITFINKFSESITQDVPTPENPPKPGKEPAKKKK